MEQFYPEGFIPVNTLSKREKKKFEAKKIKINDKPYSIQRLTANEEYLKFNFIIKKYIMIKHKIREPHLNMILFLHSEYLFKKSEFERWRKFFGQKAKWNLFDELVDKGLIVLWKEKGLSNMRTSYYTLSKKAKLICREMHEISSQKRLMEENIEGGAWYQKWRSKFVNDYFINKPDPLVKVRRSSKKQ